MYIQSVLKRHLRKFLFGIISTWLKKKKYLLIPTKFSMACNWGGICPLVDEFDDDDADDTVFLFTVLLK